LKKCIGIFFAIELHEDKVKEYFLSRLA